ncbi:MAG: hypothetical protein EBV42_07360 [Actinobacteria bacterium]|nr:hypothetical protein [Actinomycetota bacterium]
MSGATIGGNVVVVVVVSATVVATAAGSATVSSVAVSVPPLHAARTVRASRAAVNAARERHDANTMGLL